MLACSNFEAHVLFALIYRVSSTKERSSFSRAQFGVISTGARDFPPGRRSVTLGRWLSTPMTTIGQPFGDSPHFAGRARKRLGRMNSHARAAWPVPISNLARVQFRIMREFGKLVNKKKPGHRRGFLKEWRLQLQGRGVRLVREGFRWIDIDAAAGLIETDNAINQGVDRVVAA